MNQNVATNSDNNEDQVPARESAVWSNARICTWVVTAFCLLFVFTLFIIAPQIQQRLDRQTKNRLEQAGISTTSLVLDWDYRNLTVKGNLPDGVNPRQLAVALRGTNEQPSALFARGIRHLRLDLDEGLPDYVRQVEENLLVQVSGNGVSTTLNGVVQNDAQRSALVQAVLASGTENVYDNLDIQSLSGSDAVNKRVDALAGMLKQLGPMQVRRTEITMNEDELNYRISARDKDSAHLIESVAAVQIPDFNVTGGVNLVSSNSLYLVTESDGEKITLKGEVYSETQHKRLLFAADEAVGSQNVVDNLRLSEITSNAPELMDRVGSVATIVSRLAPGITADVTLRNGELTVNAETGSESVRDYLMASITAARGTDLQLVENIRVLSPEDDSQSLQTELNQLVTEIRQTVVFSSGDSLLSPQARKTLDKVAAHINRFSGLVVEVEGHTDDVGRANINEQLSQSRANAVRDYLASSVAKGNRLIAVGYGHRRPLEPNDTAEGRQANRRVHFTVLKQTDGLTG